MGTYNNEHVISVIQRYISDNLLAPSLSWNNIEFKRNSYKQWAAYELCFRIMDNPFENPIRIIDNFHFEMLIYAETENETCKFIFKNALEVADEILLMLV